MEEKRFIKNEKVEKVVANCYHFFCISFLFGSKMVAICYHLSKISQALRHTPPCQRNIELQSPNGFLPPVTKVTVGTYHTSIPAAILKCTPITQKM